MNNNYIEVKNDIENRIDELVNSKGLDSFNVILTSAIDSAGLVPNYVEPIVNDDITETTETIVNDSSYINNMVEYAKTLDIKHYQELRKMVFRHVDIFEYASKHNLSNDDIELMICMSKVVNENLDAEVEKIFPSEFIVNDTVNDSTRDDIISIVTDVLNDDKIEYSIDGEYDSVYDLLNESNILSHKNSVEYSNLLYEFDVKYIKKHPEEFKTYEDIIHTDTLDDKVDRYMNDSIYPILKNLNIDVINGIIN
ncbi:MAG: hypothetical protein ACRCX8_02915 [Sarcina sp.]